MKNNADLWRFEKKEKNSSLPTDYFFVNFDQNIYFLSILIKIFLTHF